MNPFLKRIFDLVLVIPAIIVLLPIFLIIFLIIKLTDRGPAIFRQQRAGKHGKPFILYKFRTMKADVDPFGHSPKHGKDPRITPIGRLLRETSLDELPQLFNILKGDMSMVGPRPLYVSQVSEWNETQKKRLLVKPGLTGLAQISGRGGLTREQKLDLDVKYVMSAGFRQDVKILFRTFLQIFSRKGIYEQRYSEDQYTRSENGENAS